MNIKLKELLEAYPKRPPISDSPVRRVGREIITYITKYSIGQGAVKKWELDGNIMRFYVGTIHHDPLNRNTNQFIPRLLAAAIKYNLSFRIIADGNLIGIVMELSPEIKPKKLSSQEPT